MYRSIAFFLCLIVQSGQAQEMHLYSIARARQPSGDNDYTLDGPNMQVPRSRLLDPQYYGPAGIYKKTIHIHDTFSLSNSLTGLTALDHSVIFFFGGFNALDGSLQKFTETELDSFYKWTHAGGKVIFTGGIFAPGLADYSYLNRRYGFDTELGTNMQLIGDANAPEGTPFNGPFGPVNPIRQGGGAQAYYSRLPESSQVLATDASGRPTLIMDCATMDILVPDVDVFTVLSADHNYFEFSNQDRFLGNIIAFLDNLPEPPVLKVNEFALSVQGGYAGYQWYHNDEPVEGATGNTFSATKKGTYYVEVSVPGGCKVRSDPFIDGGLTCEPFVPLAFSPDGNGTNESACIYGSCLDEFDFTIFDRWGEMVFRSQSAADCWDGTFRGQKMSSGAYAWSLTVKTAAGHKVRRNGNITLIR